jgi:hypothetical protein
MGWVVGIEVKTSGILLLSYFFFDLVGYSNYDFVIASRLLTLIIVLSQW